MDPKTPDPEMLKQLEFLLEMETLENETDWEAVSQLQELEKAESEDSDSKKKESP